MLINGEKDVDELAKMSIDLLKLIHSKMATDIMPDMKAVAQDWADFLQKYLPADQYTKLRSLIDAVPADMHIMHGDYHLKNVMLQDGETLLIDMDTLCHGHPIFELASIYNAYQGYCATDHSIVEYMRYSMNGFVEAARVGGPGAGLGNGAECDAIAACVIGGVSFIGGIGKISGIVVGVILLQLISVALQWMSVSANLVYIINF